MLKMAPCLRLPMRAFHRMSSIPMLMLTQHLSSPSTRSADADGLLLISAATQSPVQKIRILQVTVTADIIRLAMPWQLRYDRDRASAQRVQVDARCCQDACAIFCGEDTIDTL